jgi:hypothetical protein
VFRCGCLFAVLLGPLIAAFLFTFFAPTSRCDGCVMPYPTPTVSAASPAAVASTAGVPAPGTRAEGTRFAQAQLALVRWPTGARVDTAPPLVMQRPPLFGWQMGQDVTVAGGTTWRLPLPVADAVAYFQGNPPAGWRLTLLDPTGRMSGSVGGAINTVLVYGRGPAPPPGVWAAQVLVSLHPDGPAASLARVDVQVGWFDARAAAEYVAGFAAMTVTGPTGVTRTFSSPSQIAAVARLLNGLPAAPWDDWLSDSTAQYDCTVPGDGYTVAFAVKRGGLPWMKVILDPGNTQIQQGCRVDVSVWSTSNPSEDGYQLQPSLVDTGGGVASYLATLMRLPAGRS